MVTKTHNVVPNFLAHFTLGEKMVHVFLSLVTQIVYVMRDDVES